MATRRNDKLNRPAEPPDRSLPKSFGSSTPTWRAANYLSVGQIYLLDNPLLRRPLEAEDVKPRLLGHWGTTPGLNLIYAHMNREIKARDLNCIYIIGPGHGRPGPGRQHLPRGQLHGLLPQASPATRMASASSSASSRSRAGSPATSPRETPGSIHRGRRNSATRSRTPTAPPSTTPTLLVCCVVGDGEAETGPLATGWHSNKFLDPKGDGAVLPILHLNGYKIANPPSWPASPRSSCAT